MDNFRLSTIEKDHLPLLREWRNDERIFNWCRQNNLIDEISHANWYEWQSKDPNTRMFSILMDNKIIGVCGLTSIDFINNRAEFSLYIDPNKQSYGFGSMGLKRLLGYGFNTLNLNSIWGETFEGNPALYMFEKIGFAKEGTRRDFYFKNGKYIDAHLVSIKREEWKKQQQS